MLIKIWFFLRPNLVKLVILTIIISLTLLVVTEREATSKVTWSERRGIPLPYLTLLEYRGPCPPLNFCTKVSIQNIYPFELLFNIFGWYIVSCILFLAYEKRFKYFSLGERN
jgi:hypothetical protein